MTRELEQETIRLLTEYFSRDPRFAFYDYVASGSYGSTYRIQYRENENSQITDFLIKLAHQDEDEDDEDEDPQLMIETERNFLRAMRGGEHISRLIEFNDDPLTVHQFPRSWLALEWIPNGTVINFIRKARDKGVTRLPNRLLWRLFLCLVRGCCGMSWPRNRQDGRTETELPIPGVPAGGFAHRDLHTSNVLFGDLGIAGEHGISPIMKIIDFGLTEMAAPTPAMAQEAMDANVQAIGKVMIELITLNPRIIYEREGTFVFNHLGQDIETDAHLIFQSELGMYPLPFRPYEWLDDWMRVLVGMCRASPANAQHIPNLQSLSVWIPYAIRNRDARFYGNREESDVFIRQLMCHILFDA
ncbi:uncharacterized protein GGS22DRAFT_200011 [Annulohypoxylon maeteangense]|uniref:uncharacterized protein n=1 Tax=Annulohypoxylon maeteangense TaxID=1927788 RepID=UPI002007AF20|nr:uncharacterized protein GGS22DRAFT_200011 [Annulohypoxylon maeteangense]KAI0885859.1 hypothetical protein GGS22DRAFT_200011 [Annulohypoxylon maeteangense]